MNPPPIPQPSSYTCPNCGTPIEGRPQFCPRCGASLLATTSNSNGCVMIGVQVFLACLALFLGLFGVCFVAIGGSDFRSGGWGFVGFGLGILFVAALCIWGIIKISKR